MRNVWKLYWIWVSVTIGLYAALVGWAGPVLSDMAAGLTLFDLRTTGYDHAEAVQYLTNLSPEGAAFYTDVWYPLDMIFLSFITVAMAVGLWALFTHSHGLWRKLIPALPVAYGLADILENNAVFEMVQGGLLGLTPNLVEWSSLLTQIKFGFFAVSVLMIIVGLILRLRRAGNAG